MFFKMSCFEVFFFVISLNQRFLFSSDNQAAGSATPKSATTRPKGSVIDLTEDDDDVQGKA